MGDRDTWELIEGAERSSVVQAEEEDGWSGIGAMRWRPRPQPIAPMRTTPLTVKVFDAACEPLGVVVNGTIRPSAQRIFAFGVAAALEVKNRAALRRLMP